MLSRRTFSLAVVALAAGATAWASQPANLIVAVRYVLTEQSPDRLEEMVANVIERALVKVPRTSLVTATINQGRVDVDMHFKSGASDQDLIAVTQTLKQIEFGNELQVISLDIGLETPRPR